MFLSLGNTQESDVVQPTGPKDSRICIISDSTSGYDRTKKRPFSGPYGQILETCLHLAGMIRGNLYLTNLFKQYKPLSYFYNDRKGSFTSEGEVAVEYLREELLGLDANIFVAMGPVSLKALTGKSALRTYRGYLLESTLIPGRKVIGTLHPSSVMFANTEDKNVIIADLKKTLQESYTRELVRPERELVLAFSTVGNVLEWLDYFNNQKIVGFDIEVINYEVSCISLSSDPKLACSIPIAGRWSLEEEMQIWRGLQKILGNPNIEKVVQNGMFDIPFLHDRNHLVVRGPVHDTMIAHSVIFPDLPKGLNFLGSIYCGSQEYWKGMVKFKNIKEEA